MKINTKISNKFTIGFMISSTYSVYMRRIYHGFPCAACNYARNIEAMYGTNAAKASTLSAGEREFFWSHS